MKNLFILITFCMSNATAMNKSEEQTEKEFVRITAEYLNTFKTAEEFLNETHRMNILGSVEKASIEEFLKEKQIPLSTKLLQNKARALKIEWKNESLTIIDADVVKTNGGRIVKLKNKAADVIFKEVFNAETAKKSVMNLIIEEAQAESVWISSSVDAAVSKALTALSLNFKYEFYHNVEAPLNALDAKLKYETLLLLRSSKADYISCYDGKFVHEKRLGAQEAEKAEVRKNIVMGNRLDVHYGKHRELTEYEITAQTYEELREKLVGTYVHSSILRKVWKSGDIPKCDKTTLVSAQKALLDEINLYENNIQRRIRGLKPFESPASAAENGSQHSQH